MNDVVRTRVREALARRAGAQPEAVRRVLATKLQDAAPIGLAQGLPAKVQVAARTATCAPLAELNARLRELAAAKAEPALPGEPHDARELASVRRFRRAWDRSRTLDQVEQAIARGPANAGPLNSHALVLQSLALMRELSPEYLRHFLRYAESLQWLAQVHEKLPRDAGKPPAARRARQKK